MLMMLMGLLSNPAAAAPGPYMWGVGPVVNTMVLPGAHPVSFPADTRVENEDGKKLSVLDKTQGDIGFGVHGVLYMKKAQRVGTHAWFQTGSGEFRSSNITFEYDFVGSSSNGVTVLAGLGGGFGTHRWKTRGEGELKGNTYILRGQAGANYRTRKNCYEVAAYLNWNIPGQQTWEVSDEDEASISGGFYPVVGIEATMFFGDFKPPKAGASKRRGKKSGRR